MNTVRLVFLLAFLLLSACGKTDNEWTEGSPFLFAQSEHQRQVLEKLESRGIPHYTDDQGYVHTPLSREAEVLGIQRSVYYGDQLRFDVTESTVFYRELEVEIVLEMMGKAGIPFTTERENESTVIIWSQLHGPKVDAIRQAAKEKYLEQAREKNRRELARQLEEMGQQRDDL